MSPSPYDRWSGRFADPVCSTIRPLNRAPRAAAVDDAASEDADTPCDEEVLEAGEVVEAGVVLGPGRRATGRRNGNLAAVSAWQRADLQRWVGDARRNSRAARRG